MELNMKGLLIVLVIKLLSGDRSYSLIIPFFIKETSFKSKNLN